MRTIEILTAVFAASTIQLASADGGVVPPPGPVQDGAPVDRCGGWALAAPGTTCYDLAQSLNMDLITLQLLNPQLKHDCVHNLWSGYYYCSGIAEDKTPFRSVDVPPPPPKETGHHHNPHHEPHDVCKEAHDDKCASAVFAAKETPAPMVDWCKRYLGGPTCTEEHPEGIFSSYDKFPQLAMGSSLCAYPSAPPAAPRFSKACECFTQMHPLPTSDGNGDSFYTLPAN
ncbi:hypothetical protein F5Y01DRAFT_325686 [Xylaria sp. FL0043]|nr:hypothetical protein F5Y01DRAFT_325686 [Xylaria sp. FL0043]